MKEFKIRCSAIGKIMTNDRSGKGMGKTAQTYCQNWLREQIYNRKITFESKYTQKGNEVEDNSLDFIADQLGLGLLFKNEQYFEDDFMCGTPDAVSIDFVIDAKNSYDFSTFPIFDEIPPTEDYVWQGLGYMHLTDRKKFKLCYTLMDTPLHLIERDAYYWCKANGYEELDMDIYDQFVAKMTYPDIPAERKIKVFDIAYDPQKIEAIQNRVVDCRNYIKTLKY